MSHKLIIATAALIFGGFSAAYAAEVEVEAESATLIAPMVIVEDEAASGGKYIHSTAVGKGDAVIEFEVAEDGEYEIWVKGRGMGGNNDSFFFIIDDGKPLTIDVRTNKDFKWQPAVSRETKSSKTTLTKGKHKLIIRSREKDTQLDKVIIAKPGFKPEE